MSSEERYIVFSATGANAGIVNVLNALARNMITQHFPPNFFKGGVHIDTKTGIRDMYKNENQLDGSNNNQNVSKIKKPRISIAYNFRNMDTKETGLGPAAFGQYPNTHVLRKNLNGYWRFLEDPITGIKLYTSDLRVKIEFDVIIDMSSRDDQVSMINYLYNIIKFNRGHWYQIDNAKFTLPNMLMYGLYRCMYGNLPANDHAKEFGEWLKTKSNAGVVQEFLEGNEKVSFYRMVRNYKNLFVTMTGEPEMGDPESKDMVYDKFSITFSGYLEPYLPIAYIFHSPDKVNNTFINNAMFLSPNPDEFNNYIIKFFTRTCKSLQYQNSPVIRLGMRKVLDEEFYVDEPTLDLEFLEAFSEPWIKLINKLSRKDIEEIFDIRFYENGVYLDHGDFVQRVFENPEDKIRFRISDCSPTKDYTILAFCDDKRLKEICNDKGIPLE